VSDKQQPQQRTTTLHNTFYDDFEEDFFFPPKDSNEKSTDGDLYASLRKRQASLEQEHFGLNSGGSLLSNHRMITEKEDEELSRQIRMNWKEANCVSSVRLTLGDWIRRIAVDLYPLVVCGSARGHLYLADLEAESRNGATNKPMMPTTTDGKHSVGQLDCLKHVHASHLEESVDGDESPELLNEALEVLFGNCDGGGVLAIAAKRDFVVSSGREGGVHVCNIVGTEEEVFSGSRGGKKQQTKLYLQPLGRMLQEGQDSATKPVTKVPPLITSIVFDDQGTLWMAGYDGILRGFDYEETGEEDRPQMLRQPFPDHEVNLGSPILSMAVNDAIGCGVAATLHGGVVLFSLQDGKVLSQWNPFAASKRGEFARSAMIIQTDKPQQVEDEDSSDATANPYAIYDQSHYSVIVGGSKGTLFQRPLGIQRQTGQISETTPFLEFEDGVIGRRIRPNHLGQIVAMGSPSPGILVTGSHDGTMRVWDCSLYKNDEDDAEADEEGGEYDITIEAVEDNVDEIKDDAGGSRTKRPKVLYALSGYKVWLGSIFANDRKLVSDGADNSIIVHSFDEDEEDVLRSREEDEDDMEDFTFD
jgi:WD40 repeat protein